MLLHLWLVVHLLYVCSANCGHGMLYPRDSESRQTKLLDGVWQFRADTSPARNQGFQENWWTDRLLEVRILSSVIYINMKIR